MKQVARFKAQRLATAACSDGTVLYHRCAICESEEIAGVIFEGEELGSIGQVLVLGDAAPYRLAMYCEGHIPESLEIMVQGR